MNMTTQFDGRDAQLQAQAEQAEREGRANGSDPQLDRYRLVLRALRQPLLHSLPEDFSARVVARIAHAEERSTVEDWLITLLLLVLAVAGLVAVQPFVGAIATQMRMTLPELPWPMLLGSACSLAAVWLIDHLLSQRALTANAAAPR